MIIIIVSFIFIFMGEGIFSYWKTNSQKIKGIISILFFILGYAILSFWEVGSHGHFMVSPYTFDEWISLSITIVCFGVPLFFLLQYFFKKN